MHFIDMWSGSNYSISWDDLTADRLTLPKQVLDPLRIKHEPWARRVCPWQWPSDAQVRLIERNIFYLKVRSQLMYSSYLIYGVSGSIYSTQLYGKYWATWPHLVDSHSNRMVVIVRVFCRFSRPGSGPLRPARCEVRGSGRENDHPTLNEGLFSLFAGGLYIYPSLVMWLFKTNSWDSREVKEDNTFLRN